MNHRKPILQYVAAGILLVVFAIPIKGKAESLRSAYLMTDTIPAPVQQPPSETEKNQPVYNKDNGRITISDSYIMGGKYLITISDTGIGIAVNEIASIFERFRKSAHSNEESHGLGLSIVKSIADYHGITLQVRSTPGEGSQFDIVFPWQLVKE